MNAFVVLMIFLSFMALNLPNVFAFGGGNQVPGGWNEADKNDARVIDAARFAVDQQFHGERVDFKIVKAMQQVVAGINYDFLLNIHNVNNIHCQVDHVQVYDRFGTKTLTLAQITSQNCENLRHE